MRIAVVGLCAVLAAGTAQGATFYYVSSPYTASNYDTDTPPMVTTGVLDIDETQVPGGLANSRVDMSVIRGSGERDLSWREINPAVRSMRFSNGIMDLGGSNLPADISTEVYFQFDADERIEFAGGFIGTFIAEGDNESMFSFNGGQESYEGPGTRGGHYAEAERGGFSSFWTSDPVRWARQVANRVLYAASNPPSNACRVAALEADDFPLA